MSYYSNSRSPPPLQHPVPTHPTYIPDPPSTPSSPQGYQRYTSSPQPPYAAAVSPNASMGSRGPQPPTGYVSGYPPVGAQQQPRQPTVRGQQPGQAHAPPQQQGPAVDFTAWGFDDATAQFGMQLGQNAVAAGQDYVQRRVSVLLLL